MMMMIVLAFCQASINEYCIVLYVENTVKAQSPAFGCCMGVFSFISFSCKQDHIKAIVWALVLCQNAGAPHASITS